MSERLRDLIAYVVAVDVLVAGSYVFARLDKELVTKLRPHAASADAVGTEPLPPRRVAESDERMPSRGPTLPLLRIPTRSF